MWQGRVLRAAFHGNGEDVIYVIRGGEKDRAKKVIDPGCLRVQRTEETGKLRIAYDNTIAVAPYDELPPYLRDLIPREWAEKYGGKGGE